MKNPIGTGLTERGIVWMPSIKGGNKVHPFRPKQIRFLHAYSKGIPFEDICNSLNMTQEEGLKLLSRKRCREYLAELDEMDATLLARASKSRIAHEILEVWDGRKSKSREQMEAAKELWSRVWPKPSGEGSSGEKLEVRININKIEEAVKRQEAIEAEIVK